MSEDRTRAPRQEQEKRQRRRRTDDSGLRQGKLSVEGSLDDNYSYRWINDEPGRVHALTVNDDWDVVTLDQLGSAAGKHDKSVGTGMERVVSRDGAKAVLVRKLRTYYEEDKAKAQEHVDLLEKSIGEGAHGPEGLQAGEGYVPEAGIKIGSKNS